MKVTNTLAKLGGPCIARHRVFESGKSALKYARSRGDMFT